MKKTKTYENANPLMVNTPKLQELLCCGRYSAVRIGEEAKAKIHVGKMVFWNVSKVKTYLDNVAV